MDHVPWPRQSLCPIGRRSACSDLEQGVLRRPHDLLSAAFNVNTATIDALTVKEVLMTKILKLSVPTIEREIFAALCPNDTSKPHVVLESIKQWSTDKEGITKIQTVQEYFTRFSLAARPFAQMKSMPVDVCLIFIHALHRYKSPVRQALFSSCRAP